MTKKILEKKNFDRILKIPEQETITKGTKNATAKTIFDIF